VYNRSQSVLEEAIDVERDVCFEDTEKQFIVHARDQIVDVYQIR